MIEKLLKVVLDTNVVVAGLLARASPPARVVASTIRSSNVLLSSEVLGELEEVFRRPKFDRYQDPETRLRYLWLLIDAATMVSVTDTVFDCRDPKDNMLLELALSGKADLIVTGDKDLLSLHPWRGVAILSPAEYLAQFG